MSLFNVHVNRNPLTGRIVDSAYSRGKFLRADLNQASASNEQNALLVERVNALQARSSESAQSSLQLQQAVHYY